MRPMTNPTRILQSMIKAHKGGRVNYPPDRLEKLVNLYRKNRRWDRNEKRMRKTGRLNTNEAYIPLPA